jgi:hypothetical protein
MGSHGSLTSADELGRGGGGITGESIVPAGAEKASTRVKKAAAQKCRRCFIIFLLENIGIGGKMQYKSMNRAGI